MLTLCIFGYNFFFVGGLGWGGGGGESTPQGVEGNFEHHILPGAPLPLDPFAGNKALHWFAHQADGESLLVKAFPSFVFSSFPVDGWFHGGNERN